MAHIQVALKCVTPSNEYKKTKNKNMNIWEVSTTKCCWDISLIQLLNEEKKLSNYTKLQSLVTLSVVKAFYFVTLCSLI